MIAGTPTGGDYLLMSAETLPSSVIQTRGYRVLFDSRSVRLIVLLLVCLAAPVSDAFHVRGLSNRDIWWHLRTGLWILQNHALPHTGLFSQDATAPWVASSWGFDVLSAAAYKLLGLRAVPTLLMIFKLAVALITFALGYGSRGSFWRAVLLSAVAQFVLADLVLLPGAFSIIFFGIELFLLLQTRRSGNLRPLYWMPLLFLLWANLHVQFVNGLLLLGLFLLVEALELRKSRNSFFPATTLPLDRVAVVAGLSMVATLLTPYTFHIFADAVKNTYSDVLFNNFLDMTPLAFRQAQDFVFALLVMAAFLILGRQRSRDLFKLGLMITTALVGFRIERDAWLAVLSAIAVLGDTTSDAQYESTRVNRAPTPRWQIAVTAVVILTVLTISVLRLPSNEALMDRIGKLFPRRACDFIRANRFPAPLFNAYGWGGFLIWYLPEYPVVIDSRYNLYSSGTTNAYFKMIAGTERLEANAGFTHARTMLLERSAPLTRALTNLPVLKEQFEIAYEDDIAVVLLRRQSGLTPQLELRAIGSEKQK